MMVRTTGARLATGALALATMLVGAGCSQGTDDASRPAVVAEPGAAAAPADDTGDASDESCDMTSLPPRQDAKGETIKRIRAAGTLVVGIDQNSYNWGYRDPLTGRIEGFDIDLARAIAASILGDPNKITLKAVPTARRMDAVNSGEVDMIVRTMTITCERMQQVAFSAPYFNVSQSLIVPLSTEVATVAEGVRGKRVCAADNSGSDKWLATGDHGLAGTRIVENQLDCLVLMQLGEIDATLADTTLAYAQVAQDRTVKIAGESIVPGVMGVAMHKESPDLVAWVNKVIADFRASGGWEAAYQARLAATMGADSRPYRP
ncbi:glutamate ABC transporter substrate-binding protein [Yinghuangia sp. ASG 101]|uniref:glutamate ABC transporter substrate-binding protein n=1 Tax=Yinghuangia sp. ASG 101 TaxID=2896848 RepID=UPI001E61B78A|nr:glutamate ABC transporter substrate-binding protein [Yinghuangia sp. ASG 101]UGQ12978.1 glutamate ABC transporter substrate-binding protein [Yinghuangia sp. ASG 101]